MARFMRSEESQVAQASRDAFLFGWGFRRWRHAIRGREIGEASYVLGISHGNRIMQRRVLALWREKNHAAHQKVWFATAKKESQQWARHKEVATVRSALHGWRAFAALKAGRQGRFKDQYWRQVQLTHASFDYWQGRLGRDPSGTELAETDGMSTEASSFHTDV